MNEFRAIFSISSILVIRSGYAKKRSFLNISCNSKYKIYGIYINLGCRFEFTTQKLPYERISGNFSDFINFGHHAKKGHFSILAVFQNVWDLHKYGLQIWIQNAKITLWKNVGQFFWFHRFWSSGPGMQKKRSFLNISCNSKYKIYGIYINLGCRFEFTTQKLPYERISGNFYWFHQFWSSCEKRSFLNISCISKCMGFT